MVIRLSDVSDFFAKMPLTKGFYGRITINLNLGSVAIRSPSIVIGNNALEETSNFVLHANEINFPNGTCPIMIMPNTETQYAIARRQMVCGLYCR